MRHGFTIVCALVLLSIAQQSKAAVVDFQLVLDGAGNYELRADSSLGDNFGIASYSVQLVDVLTITHFSPQDGFAGGPGGNGPAGFTTLRTPDDNVTGVVFASQDTIAPTPNLVYGFGQTADSFANLGINDFTGGTQLTQPVWDANLLLATGTYNAGGNDPSFDLNSVELFSNVFVDNVGSAVEAAQITTQVITVEIPEPSTMILAGLGLVGVFASRRRKS